MSIIIFILIPGTVPLMLGYFASIIYHFVDPDFVLLSFLSETYQSTLGTLPLILEIVIIKLVVLTAVIPYIRRLLRKNPDKSLKQIGLSEVDKALKTIKKPEKIRKPHSELSAD